MFVRDSMTPNPITVAPTISVPDALRLMHEKKVRRLPVVDGHGRLVGIVSAKDLLEASPSPATTLSVWEIPQLLAQLKVGLVMTREVITVSEDTPLEEAARTMADRRIGGLPVMRGDALVGIITETDLFKDLLALLGGRRRGVRLTAAISGVKGAMARLTGAAYAAGGNIVGVGIREVEGAGEWEVLLKVQDVPAERLVEAVRPAVIRVIAASET